MPRPHRLRRRLGERHVAQGTPKGEEGVLHQHQQQQLLPPPPPARNEFGSEMVEYSADFDESFSFLLDSVRKEGEAAGSTGPADPFCRAQARAPFFSL